MRKLRRDCGSDLISIDELRSVKPPAGTRTHVPLAHHRLRDAVVENLRASRIKVVNEESALSKDKLSYFGLLHLRHPKESKKDYGFTIGMRNNNNKRFPAELCGGTNTFICDNGIFFGETKISRRHTVNAWKDLPGLVDQAISNLNAKKIGFAKRLEAYKEKEMSQELVHDFVIRAYNSNIIGATRIPKVLQEYNEPRHKEFREAGKTLYTLMQAFTEIAKSVNIHKRSKQTLRLTGMLDKEVGILPMNPVETN